jgi:8-oxo-dGTP diphosphatase
MVLRAQPPSADHWSIPGGRVEPGEDAVAAVHREVLEETGLSVEVVRLLGVVELDGPPAAPGAPLIVYVAQDFLCTPVGSTVPASLQAADDAAAAAWVGRAELAGLDVVPNLVTTLGQWGVLPR